MENGVNVVKLDTPGPNGGTAVLIVDSERGIVSLLEIRAELGSIAHRHTGNAIQVLEVQEYTKVAR